MIWYACYEALSLPCKYEAIGCGEMVRANELSDQLEYREQHLQLAMDIYCGQTGTVGQGTAR